MRPVEAGKLRHRITINQPSLGTATAYGNAPVAWALVGKFWASIEPIGGREFEVAKSYAATVSHKISMRYAPGILPTCQIVFGTRTFNINGIMNAEGRNRMLVMFCTEKIVT